MQYMGIDGNPHMMSQEDMQSPLRICGLSCCPCCVPPICSNEQQTQYKTLLKSVTFITSMIQIIMFIVELSLAGKNE